MLLEPIIMRAQDIWRTKIKTFVLGKNKKYTYCNTAKLMTNMIYISITYTFLCYVQTGTWCL